MEINNQPPAAPKQYGLNDITVERVKALIQTVQSALPALNELSTISQQTQSSVINDITDFALSLKTAKLDKDKLEAFYKKTYYIQPVSGKKDTWELIMPAFVDMQVGWINHAKCTESFNVFTINRYSDWLGEIPEAIKKQLNWKTPPELLLDGEELQGSPEAKQYALKNYSGFVRKDGDKVKVHQKRAFELIAALIKDGILPFKMKPVDPNDLTERKFDWELRDYQKDVWNKFLQYSNIGIYIPPSTGKTVCALHIITHIKGKHLIVVPTRLLKEQWTDRIQAHTDLKPEEYNVMTYQEAVKKASKEHWATMIVDEHHHMPSDTFVKLSFINRKHTVGLSATPFREDGREDFVLALTGYPVGLSWEHFKEAKIIKPPTTHVWILKSFEAKIKMLDQLLQNDMKTVIFSDSIETGNIVAKRFSIPFVNGNTKDNWETVNKNRTVIVSRVGDEGMSLPELERVIEISWLYGSRRQELQRNTRLLHSQADKVEAHILMTLEEYVRDRKRLYGIMDKGFKLVLHKEGLSDRVIENAENGNRTTPVKRFNEKTERNKTVAYATQQVGNGQSATYLKMPGIQKIINQLSKKEAEFFTLLLDHDGEWFNAEKLPFLLGYISKNAMMNSSINFTNMVNKGWIERQKGNKVTSYRTNMRGKMGGT